MVQQEWRRAHAEGAEDAERKASHRWGKMEEDVLPAAPQPPKGGEERGVGEGKIASSRFAQSTQET